MFTKVYCRTYFPKANVRACITPWMRPCGIFHAIHRYLECGGDRTIISELLPVLRSIFEHHVRGTLFGIHVDAADGLLAAGQEGYQLTWMDATYGISRRQTSE